MQIKTVIFLIIAIALLIPLHSLQADECDDDYQQAKQHLESARSAHEGKDYETAAVYYEKAAEYYQRIAERGKCWCPKILRAAPSNAQKYFQKAQECGHWAQESGMYEQYQRAVEICTEGHTFARQQKYEAAIPLFEEAAEIWDEIGENTDSRYSQKAVHEAARAREAADYARKYVDE